MQPVGAYPSPAILHIPAFTWTPASATGATLKGFIDFEDNTKITNVSGAVSQIVDSISTAAFAQSTASLRPLLINSPTSGRQVASFDGTDDAIPFTGIPTGWPTGANTFETAVIGTQTSPGSDNTVRVALGWGFSGTTAATLGRTVSGGAVNRATLRVGNSSSTIISVGPTTPDFSGSVYARGKADGTTIWVAFNGVVGTGVACVPAVGSTKAVIGAASTNVLATFWKGEISALLVYAGALSQEDINNLAIWARIRMGI